MAVSPDARTPSALVHTLSGCSASRGRPFAPIATLYELPHPAVPLGAAAAGVSIGLETRRAPGAHPDAGLIGLAVRVRRLAETDHRAWDRRAAIMDAAAGRLPPEPELPSQLKPWMNENRRSDGSNGLLFDPPDWGTKAVALSAQYRAALADRERVRTEIEAELGLPWWVKLSERTFRRLKRWSRRLARMEAQTVAGLKAKAEAHIAVDRTGNYDDWTADLAASVSRDALRFATAACDASASRDPMSDPIVAMHRRAEDLFAYAETDATPNDEAMAALDQMNALILAGPAVPPTTPAGALAALEWGRAQLIQMMEQRDADTRWDRAVVSNLDGALAVFRQVFAADDAPPAANPSPTNDAALLAAIADLHRLDALQLLLCQRYERDTQHIPGYAETEASRDAALKGVLDIPASSWNGVVAKAGVLKAPSVWHDRGISDEVANSLAEDLLRLAGRGWDPKTSRQPQASAAEAEAA